MGMEEEEEVEEVEEEEQEKRERVVFFGVERLCMRDSSGILRNAEQAIDTQVTGGSW